MRAVRLGVVHVVANRRPEAGNADADAVRWQPLADEGALLAPGGILAQRRRRGDHLERRSGRIEAVSRAIEVHLRVRPSAGDLPVTPLAGQG